MTDNEIIKALEYCRQQGITSECERCKIKSGCRAMLIENAFELINRQKAEIEQWKEEANKYQSLWASACTEAKADVVEVVRCKDCKYNAENGGDCDRSYSYNCSCGERKEE